MMNPYDATAMAIFFFEGGNTANPNVRNIRNCNPGNLRPYTAMQVTDADGYRTFPTFTLGWQALLGDISAKLTVHLTKKQTMLDFFNLYAPGADHNDPHGYAQYVCRFLSDALAKTITLASALGDIYQ